MIIRRSPSDVLLIENPEARLWRSYAEKLNWAVIKADNPARRIDVQVMVCRCI